MRDEADVLEAMPVGFIGIDRDWRVTYINAAGEAVVDKTREELVGASYWEAFPANVSNEFGRTYREVVATGEPQSVEAFYPEPLNRWFEVQAVPAPEGLSLYFSEVTERRMAQDRLALLAQVSAELAGTLDVDAAISRITRMVTPLLGEACLLTVLGDEGRPSVAAWHVDPEMRPLLERYATARLATLSLGPAAVESLLATPVTVTGEDLPARLPAGEPRDLLRSLGFRSAVSVPLPGRDRTVGALTLFSHRTDAPKDAVRLAVGEVAERVGLALDNARLLEQQSQLAEGLQRSLLGADLASDSADIVVRYLPAAEAARVGGDWYDAFRQPSGATMLVIGDVVGHDTAAAAAMGQLRALLRGIAVYSDEGPAEVLRGLDAAMAQLHVATYATVAVARFEQTAEEHDRGVTRMRWSNGGHLPPLVIHPDGSLAALADWRGDLLLGVDGGTTRTESVVTLDQRSTVLLFTDGLIERRDGDLDAGMETLRAAAAELAGCPLDVLCDQLVQRLVDGRPEDDVALVAIRLRDAGELAEA